MSNPFYYAQIWRDNKGAIIGEIIDIKEYVALLRGGLRLHSFTGRTATVCLLDEDVTITREMKLDFAIIFMKGRYVTITVNLKDLTSTTTTGSPPPDY